jgi:hypothetical protein
MLSVISAFMLNVVMLIDIMLNVVMLSVMLNVMAPTCLPANITILINYDRKNFNRTEP